MHSRLNWEREGACAAGPWDPLSLVDPLLVIMSKEMVRLAKLLTVLTVLLLAACAFSGPTKIGTSRLGRDILLYKVGTGPKSVLILGGVHGDELPSVPLVNNLLDCVGSRPDLIKGYTVYFILQVNPDGVAAGTRFNAAGVDLNRNMEFDWSPFSSLPPGAYPYSEPETVALRDTIESIKPSRILSVHAYANILDFDTNEGMYLAGLMSGFNGMTVSTISYPTPGSLGRYCTAKKIPLVTLELPGGLSDASMWLWQRPALIAFILGF